MNQIQEMYLELLKKTIIDLHRSGLTEYRPAQGKKLAMLFKPFLLIANFFGRKNLTVCQKINFNLQDRMNGKDLPLYADSMIGYKRLSNVQHCVIDVIENNIEGDLIETGVWRGGTVIFMNGILKAYNVTNRKVWVADSFEGLPKPDAAKYEADKDDKFYTFDELRISLEIVKQNFEKYDLLNNNIKFLKGWFKDTLANASIEKLSILRLDGDMYESTMDSLSALYPKLSVGGYIIIDDWGSVEGCRLAVLDYRKKFNINQEIMPIDDDGVFWKK